MTTLNNKIVAPTPVQGTPAGSGQLEDLLALMARLRADCPWDKKQTNHSLIPYAIEEAYELGEAVQSEDDEDIKGELGDVLLQVVFHCQMYAEQGRFDMSDVITTLQEKLVRRHPHVFEAETLKDDAAVKERWDEIKAEENQAREARGKPPRRLDAIKAGSALMQAQDVQKQASKLGFDWDGISGAFDKLEEEIDELKAELTNKSKAEIKANIRDIEKELGDCMFALVNVTRKLNLDAETATLTCVHKFKSRFGYIEEQLAAVGKRFEESDITEMDALWDAAKRHERL
ncbi:MULTISPECIES: nucleoside triphosphate pyrophosphohydrolase [Psychrobacter]|uniref:Nucleoside triphosphate pyrophosphohydrolase MazG n=1 Tax=Psychrobacter alimentarius TaxID=261164 RepID=A0ABM5ZUV7_9GAMM|nr:MULTISPECIES: nucleoside triphosphate pyrophosphohydrolase [Psychrobacter]AMT95785.1 Nucleoside triphosphate pyrophosphohydrolase MazG [Psychrobacter alimentarius]QCB31789.1 nucleoside triphosphate pyrophosphohydrolase [Psychrobacter sp. PAMC27889]